MSILGHYYLISVISQTSELIFEGEMDDLIHNDTLLAIGQIVANYSGVSLDEIKVVGEIRDCTQINGYE